MKVFILTEGGKRIGFGHIARCIALAEAFGTKGIKPCFIVAGDNSVKEFLRGKENIIFNWPDKQNKLLRYISGADVVIIDSYLAKSALYKKIADCVRLGVYLDDNNRIIYPKGIIINGAIYAKKLSYPKAAGRIYLLGPKFLALRKAFWNLLRGKTRKQIKSVMITFGGSDLQNMTPRVLDILTDGFPHFTKKVVIGQGFNNLRQIIKAADRNTQLIYYSNVAKMIKAMRSCDIVISAAGQTLYELARVGVAALVVIIAKNQLNNAIAWQDSGFTDTLGWWKDKNIASKIAESIKNLRKEDIRMKRSLAGRRLIDGRGAVRISNFIESSLKKYDVGLTGINLREAKIGDCRDIWLWRNSLPARRASFNVKKISFSRHKQWFRSKLAGKHVKIYIAQKNSKKIGVIRFGPKGGQIYVNVNLNPVFLGKGFGNKIIKFGTKKFMSEAQNTAKIIAEIKGDNIISQKAFAKAGYKHTGNGIKRIIYTMERRDVR